MKVMYHDDTMDGERGWRGAARGYFGLLSRSVNLSRPILASKLNRGAVRSYFGFGNRTALKASMLLATNPRFKVYGGPMFKRPAHFILGTAGQGMPNPVKCDRQGVSLKTPPVIGQRGLATGGVFIEHG